MGIPVHWIVLAHRVNLLSDLLCGVKMSCRVAPDLGLACRFRHTCCSSIQRTDHTPHYTHKPIPHAELHPQTNHSQRHSGSGSWTGPWIWDLALDWLCTTHLAPDISVVLYLAHGHTSKLLCNKLGCNITAYQSLHTNCLCVCPYLGLNTR